MKNINKLIKISIFALSLLTQAPITPDVHEAFTGLIEQADRDALAAELEASTGGDNKKESDTIQVLNLIKIKLETIHNDRRPFVFEVLMRKLIEGNKIADDYNRDKYMYHLRSYITTGDIAHNGFMRTWLQAGPTDESAIFSASAFGTGYTVVSNGASAEATLGDVSGVAEAASF